MITYRSQKYQRVELSGIFVFKRDAATSNSVSNFNLTNRSFEFNTGSFRGDVLFMQFTYADNSKSDVSNKTITSVSNCEPMVTPPTNQTVINNVSDTGKSIVFSVIFLSLVGLWTLSMKIMWKIPLSEKNYVNKGEYVITKGKYLKTFLIMVNYVLTMTLMNVISAELPKFLDVPVINDNVDFLYNLTSGVFVPFMIISLLMIIWFVCTDVWDKGRWFRTEKI